MKPTVKILSKASAQVLGRRDLLVGEVAISVSMKKAYMKTSSGGLVRLEDGTYLTGARSNHLTFTRPTAADFNITE